MNKNILLNWFPPSTVEMPSPAMSVLKSYLLNNGFNVTIEYWNSHLMELQREFIWWGNQSLNQREFHALLLFYNYIAIQYKDKDAYCRVKAALIGLKPQYLNINTSFYDNHMEDYAKKFDNLLISIIEKSNISEQLFIGMSMNLYQWICAAIVGKKIKEYYPNIPIIIGGIGHKEAAISFLKNFSQFDIAIWGEGEYILTELGKFLSAKSENDTLKNTKIPGIAFRINGTIDVSEHTNHHFVDLSENSICPNFDDYFKQLPSNINKKMISIFIEGGRGCHWKKCNFCYLNTGYKNRTKRIDNIVCEIKNAIATYGVNYFQFLDNDIIANDLIRFEKLLDEMILIKEEYPEFTIILAEIITHGVSAGIIKKMSLAGFLHVQIGYESASNELLKKINKKNTFASNLLFIKFGSKYNIHVEGANIIKGLLEEKEEDIIESIENLRMLRFFFRNGFFSHSKSSLGITKSSRYFAKIQDFSDFKHNALESYLPSGFISEEEIKELNFTEKVYFNESLSWANFDSVEDYYLKSIFEYELLIKNHTYIYREYQNRSLINELEFDHGSFDWDILQRANDNILSISQVKDVYKDLTDCEIVNNIEELKNEGLLYTNKDYSEMIATIDVGLIK